MSKLAIRVLQFLAFLFSFQFSLQRLSFSALLLTLTMPLAKPLLRLAAFDKRRLSLIGLPKIHKSLSPSTTHTLLWALLKAADGVNFKRLLFVSVEVRPLDFGLDRIVEHSTSGCSSHFLKVVFLRFIFKNLFSGFVQVFLGNGKCNCYRTMLIISSKFGILWVLIKTQILYCLHFFSFYCIKMLKSL